MHRYITEQSGYGTVSEYIRSLVREDQQRRADTAARPVPLPRRLNDTFIFADALQHVERLKALLEGKELYEA